MVRVGLVAYVEEQLERAIALGMLPRGQFGSEEKLAREFGCCRGTVREALRRLAARGLVVQRSGRKTRAVALDESLTLENLGLALHDERRPECRRLLEGFFSLKRQVLVELLADCCTRASDAALGQLEDACFWLSDAARWNPGERCAQWEFELLRLAARAAERPGHLLLIQSLQRALRGNATRLLSLMGGETLRQWVFCAIEALRNRDARALQHELPALLKACDERVLEDFAPVPQEQESPEAECPPECLPDVPASASAQDDAPAAGPCVEERGPDHLAPAAGATGALGIGPRVHEGDLPVEPDRGTPRIPAAPGLTPGEPQGACSPVDVTGAAPGNIPDCRAGGSASSQEEEPLARGEAQGERAASWPPGARPHHEDGGQCASDASMAQTPEPPAS